MNKQQEQRRTLPSINYYQFSVYQIQMQNLSPQKITHSRRQRPVLRSLSTQKLPGLANNSTEFRIGKYKFDSHDQLGHGFTGNVFKAVEAHQPQKRYAIKVIDLKKFRGAALELLETQIQIHKSLEHPNIVKLHQVFKTPQNYYLVMEYCPHGSLSEYIQQKKQLSESNALQIINQIVVAYRYLLDQGVIHRDIKPANILRVGNLWKLSDFGFAAKSKLAFRDRLNPGTPLYMAPESLRKNHYSYKSDFFSIGIVLYEMLMGQTPHEAQSQEQLLEKACQQILVPNSIKNSKVRQFLRKMCVVSEGKRMSKEQFMQFEFQVGSTSTMSLRCNSWGGLSTMDKRVSNEYVTENHSEYYPKTNCKDECWQQSTNSQHSTYSTSEQSPKTTNKNPMFINRQALQQQLHFTQHFYFAIQNIQSFHLDPNTKNTYTLSLFKLLLKLLRMLCDKNLNHLQLANWQEFVPCKLYQQLHSDCLLHSQQYEKQYLEFIKYNDIKVIRAVNRRFPQLCNSNTLTSKFYAHFKEFMIEVMREHLTEVTNLVEKGQLQLNDRFQALQSAYKIYKFCEVRSENPWSTAMREKPNLLEDYTKSKLTKSSFSNLQRIIRLI